MVTITTTIIITTIYEKVIQRKQTKQRRQDCASIPSSIFLFQASLFLATAADTDNLEASEDMSTDSFHAHLFSLVVDDPWTQPSLLLCSVVLGVLACRTVSANPSLLYVCMHGYLCKSVFFARSCMCVRACVLMYACECMIMWGFWLEWNIYFLLFSADFGLQNLRK